MGKLPDTRGERVELAARLVRGALGPTDVLRPDGEVDGDGWTVAIDIPSCERGGPLREAIAEAIFAAGFPALTSHSPRPLPDGGGYRVWIVVHLGVDA